MPSKRTYASRDSSGREYTKKRTAVNRPSYIRPVSGGISAVSNRASLGTQKSVEFLYVEQGVALSSSVGIPAVYQFNASGLFDPNRTGTGHQPMNYDQLMVLYEDYIVTECEYKVVFRQSDNNPALIGVTVSDATTVATDTKVLIENGQCQWDQIRGTVETPVHRTMKGKIDIAKCHGVTRSQLLGDAEFRGTVGANPVDMIILNVFAASTSTGSPTVSFTIELRFKAVLRGSKLNSLS